MGSFGKPLEYSIAAHNTVIAAGGGIVSGIDTPVILVTNCGVRHLYGGSLCVFSIVSRCATDMSTQTGGDPTVAHPIRVGDVPTDHEHCEKVTGFWTRANVASEHDQDYNSGIYPKECRFVDPALEDTLLREYDRTTDPRCVMAFLNGEYAPDGPRDTWVTSFKGGKGDCDR